MKFIKPTFVVFVFFFSAIFLRAEDPYANLPQGADPKDVGARIVDNYLKRPIDRHQSGIIYPEICAWYGALSYAKLASDGARTEKLIRRFDPVLAVASQEAKVIADPSQQAPSATSSKVTHESAPYPIRIAPNAHVDFRVFGVVPLELYIQTHNPVYLALGKKFADAQWKNPTADGITDEARYWVDDMYMIPALQMQAYRATGDVIYMNRAALTAASYLEKLQQPNGLFMHASDSPFYWGRGNGWFAAGMAEILRDLPENNPNYARIKSGYLKMMEALLKYQSPNGLWRQLVDVPESWTETSGSGMFTFAMVTGVKNHWLDSTTYGLASRKAWLALVAALDKNNNLTGVCVGTNKGKMMVGDDVNKQREYYLARDRKSGDLHGQSPMLWTASALLR